MQGIILFFMMVFIIAADAIIFFVIGYFINSKKIISNLRENGWKIEPPSVDKNL